MGHSALRDLRGDGVDDAVAAGVERLGDAVRDKDHEITLTEGEHLLVELRVA